VGGYTEGNTSYPEVRRMWNERPTKSVDTKANLPKGCFWRALSKICSFSKEDGGGEGGITEGGGAVSGFFPERLGPEKPKRSLSQEEFVQLANGIKDRTPANR